MRNYFRKNPSLTKCIITTLSMIFIFESISVSNVQAAVATESTVTQEMCDSSYWKNLSANWTDVVLMDSEQIKSFNQSALTTEACHMHDITAMDASFDGTALKSEIAEAIIAEAPNKTIYVNGIASDTLSYYSAVSQEFLNTGWNGQISPKYALGVSQTQIKSIPTTDYIGYSETDSDDEIILSSLRVNEPFLVKQCAIVNGNIFYWGYSNHLYGWVLADDIAFCDDKSDWLKMWQTDIAAKDFIVVTDDYFTLSESHYAPATSGVKLTMGTILKLVPDNEIPRNIAMRGTWNNYVVYLPTRDTNGKCVKQIALIAQNKSVNEGYLPMTSNNIIDLAFKYLGDVYGWGGMLDSVDCSAYVRNVYKCFGIEMPRNTTWQREVPGTFQNIGDFDSATKNAIISQCIPGTPLYLPGHTMIYLGCVNDTCYVISAMGSASDSTGYFDLKVENTVAITPLTIRRRNQTTWLENIDGIVEPWK